MGIYNEVRVEVPVPAEGFEGRVFQTKDGGGWMDHLKIDSSGRLLRSTWDSRASGRSEYLPDPFTGSLYFYDWNIPEQIASDLRYFEADFENGQLVGSIRPCGGEG